MPVHEDAQAHPPHPDTWKDIGTNYLNLFSGVAGMTCAVYGLNLLSDDPTLWRTPGEQLVELELQTSAYFLVPAILLLITAVRILVDLTVVLVSYQLVASRRATIGQISRFRRITYFVRRFGWVYNSVMASVGLTAAAYFLLKRYGLGIESDPLLTSISLAVGGALPFVLMRTGLLCRLLPSTAVALLRDKKSKELSAFDAAIPRLQALLVTLLKRKAP